MLINKKTEQNEKKDTFKMTENQIKKHFKKEKRKKYFSLPEGILDGMKTEKKEALLIIFQVLNEMKLKIDLLSDIISFCDKNSCKRCHNKLIEYCQAKKRGV